MKRLDKLIIGAFLGPFFLTFSVALFIFLTQYLLRYLDDFLGKDLGLAIFSELIFYFSMNMVPNSLPLAILISSLMTFGNLGEHHELTALKGSGISLVRTLVPIFVIVLGIAVGLYFFNNIIVPKANLKAYSLLYDIKQKKPALNIKEGSFYNGLPGYSVKVTKKFPDGKSLKGVMIYNHTAGRGNTDLIVADSGYMYTFMNEKYLALELFNGTSFTEYLNNTSSIYPAQFVQNQFDKSKIVFSLASFDLQKTQQELFASNKYMKNIRQLNKDVDSLRNEYDQLRDRMKTNIQPFYTYHFHDSEKRPQQHKKNKRTRRDKDSRKKDSIEMDSLVKLDSISKKDNVVKKDTIAKQGVLSKNNPGLKPDSIRKGNDQADKMLILSRAVNQARSIKSYTLGHADQLKYIRREGNGFEIEKYKKYVQSIACIIMFLIGAPLGAIIRKGGLGIPILIGIVFFIIFYVISMMGEKWAKENLVEVAYGMWLPIVILLPVGLFFLKQAKNDARLFESDVYRVIFDKIARIFSKK
jgi:lipopolysaccharide export system permease protein